VTDYTLIAITYIVLIGVLIAFIREKIPPYLVAMTGMVILLAVGAISTNDMLAVFSNSAPITIACMFIISTALDQTGVIDAIGRYLLKLSGINIYLGIFMMFSFILLIAFFINNTPLVIIMTPVILVFAEKMKKSASKYLIPLSYTAILGGTCTLIGTSTNILVNGIVIEHGYEAFTMFEITGAGLTLALAGLAFMALTSRFLLPDRIPAASELMDHEPVKRFMAEAVIPNDSPFIGHSLNEIQFSDNENCEVIDLVRQDRGTRLTQPVQTNMNRKKTFFQKLFPGKITTDTTEPQLSVITSFRDITLEANDRLVFKLTKDDIIELQQNTGIRFEEKKTNAKNNFTEEPLKIAEGFIPPTSAFIGRRIKDLRLRRGYDCYVVAVSRKDKHITGDLPNIILQEGDSLIIEGVPSNIDRLFENGHILNISMMRQLSFNPSKAPIALGILIGIVLLNTLGFMPIAGLSMIGALIVILTGCVTPDRAYKAIDWRILLLIFGMLGVGSAIQNTGAGNLVVSNVVSLIDDLGPLYVLAAVYLLTSLMTEIVTNNAVAIILTPIAIGIATALGYDPRPFVVAVMFAASTSFATPIGYQTNTFIYTIGGYKFTDFLKIGIPMNILMFALSMVVIPLFWSF